MNYFKSHENEMNYLLYLSSSIALSEELNEAAVPQHKEEEAQTLSFPAEYSRVGQRRLRTETVASHGINATLNELVDALVKYGNNPDGIPALHYAIKCQDAKAVSLLLNHGADPNSQSREYSGYQDIGGPLTAIDFAAAYGTPAIIKLLIDCGAKVNVDPIQNGVGMVNRASPLLFALGLNKIDNIRVLIENGADKYYVAMISDSANPPQHLWYSSVQLAALMGNTDVLKLLLESEKDVDYQLSKHLEYAQHEDVHTGYYGSSLLGLAIQSGNINIVRFLLELGADPNVGQSQRVYATNGVTRDIPHIPFISNHLLVLASKTSANLSDIFLLLMDYNLDINLRNTCGTPMLVSFIGNYEMFKNIKNPSRDIEQRLVEIFLCTEALLKNGVDIEAKDLYNRNALSCAKSPEMIELLQKYGGRG